MNLCIAKGMLSLYGLLIDTAKSGHEAIEKIKYNAYDLVLMNHLMPGMDGMKTTREVRKWENDEFLRKYSMEFPQEIPKLLEAEFSEGKRLPIVALTVDTAAGAKEMFLANGFSGFISKPIVLREMDKMLKEWLSPEKISRRARANAALSDREACNGFAASTMRGCPPQDTEQLRENIEKALTAA